MIETPKAGMSEPGRLPSSFKAAFVGDPTCNPVALPQGSYREVLSGLWKCLGPRVLFQMQLVALKEAMSWEVALDVSCWACHLHDLSHPFGPRNEALKVFKAP